MQDFRGLSMSLFLFWISIQADDFIEVKSLLRDVLWILAIFLYMHSNISFDFSFPLITVNTFLIIFDFNASYHID